MKKFCKVLTVLTLIIVVLSLTACGNASLNASNYLWFKDPSAFKSNFKETSVYSVSFVNTTNANSSAVKIDGCSLEIDDGSLVSTLEARTDKNGNYYIYTAEFNLLARFVTPNETREINDHFKSVVRFNENLTPVSTVKEYYSELTDYKYNYEITYESNKATAVLKEYDIAEENSNESVFTFNKYTKGAFVDNDMMLLIPRLYNVSNSFVQNFKTIDVLSNKNHDMQYYAYIVNQNVDVKVLPGYTLNEEQVGTDGISCNHVEIAINDTFSGSPIECYYAQDRDTHRHRLIETFTPLLAPYGNVGYLNIGYLKYSLSNVTLENDN